MDPPQIQTLRETLDRGRKANVVRYRTCIKNILGDDVDPGIFLRTSTGPKILEGSYDSLLSKSKSFRENSAARVLDGSRDDLHRKSKSFHGNIAELLEDVGVERGDSSLATRDPDPATALEPEGSSTALVLRSDDGGGSGERRARSAAPLAVAAAAPPVARYRVGDACRDRAHATRFISSSQASALLAELPLRSRLFARRSDGRFTFAVLAERRVDGRDGRTSSLVVTMDEDGQQTKVLERRHWKTCLRLVNSDPQ